MNLLHVLSISVLHMYISGVEARREMWMHREKKVVRKIIKTATAAILSNRKT